MAADGTRLAKALALAVPAALLGGAYLSQYGFGLFPCEMCWWQRYALFAALAFALVALPLQRGRSVLVFAALALLASGLIGGFHAGVEYGWWQGFTACSTALPAGMDPLEAIMNAPVVRCDVAPWALFGISLAGWNFLISTGTAAVIALLLIRRGGRRA